jgi:hypothetical protein
VRWCSKFETPRPEVDDENHAPTRTGLNGSIKNYCGKELEGLMVSREFLISDYVLYIFRNTMTTIDLLAYIYIFFSLVT